MSTTFDFLSNSSMHDTLSRGEYAYRAVRQAIHDGRFKPGQRLREIEISESLKISRTPTREALKRLEGDGLVTATSYRGFAVTKLDYGRVLELYSMREVLEGTAARFAAQHASAMELQTMYALLDKHTTQGDDATVLKEINRQLHQSIYNAAHNRYLLEALHALTDALALLEGTTFSVAGRAVTAHREHRDIVDAIAAHDPQAARAAGEAHIREAGKLRMQMITETSLERCEEALPLRSQEC